MGGKKGEEKEDVKGWGRKVAKSRTREEEMWGELETDSGLYFVIYILILWSHTYLWWNEMLSLMKESRLFNITAQHNDRAL